MCQQSMLSTTVDDVFVNMHTVRVGGQLIARAVWGRPFNPTGIAVYQGIAGGGFGEAAS